MRPKELAATCLQTEDKIAMQKLEYEPLGQGVSRLRE
jgi:hypothetical protein